MNVLSGLAPYQVLQRTARDSATAQITGTTFGSGPVTVSITGLRGWKEKGVGSAKNGKFTATLKEIPTGGPYRIRLQCEKDSIIIDPVLVGDVWLLAGQSNMQGTGDMATALHTAPGVHMFTMRRVWAEAEEPIHILEESPDSVHSGVQITPERAAELRRNGAIGAGPALSFAAELYRRTGVPQGLIATAHGGTSMAQWDPALRSKKGASLYGSMMLSLAATGQPISGLLWYQGESDATAASHALYTKLFVRFIKALRRDLKQPKLPVLTVQLGRVVATQDNQHVYWNSIQEQQRLMPEHVPQLGVVPAVDLTLCDPIHISGEGQQRLGLRLARLASSLVYKERSELLPPQFTRVRRVQDTKRNAHNIFYSVEFENVQGALHHFCEQSFTLVDADHKPVDAIYRVQTERDRVLLTVTPSAINTAVRLMYGYGCNPPATLTDSRDMALPVTGPLVIEGQSVPGPAISHWAGGLTLHTAALPELTAAQAATLAKQDALHATQDVYWPAFVNCHEQWVNRTGVACFTTEFETTKSDAALMLGAGYDGPIRIWIDEQELLNDPAGTNPVVADQAMLSTQLKPGKHRITLALDIAGGNAWGFTLRWLHKTANLDVKQYIWPSTITA